MKQLSSYENKHMKTRFLNLDTHISLFYILYLIALQNALQLVPASRAN